MKNILVLAGTAITLLISSCETDKSSNNNPNNRYSQCLGPERVVNNDHVTYMDQVALLAPEFMDSFKKYDMLQTYKVDKTDSKIDILCNVWLPNGNSTADVQLFFAEYGLSKNLNTNSITATKNNITQYDFTGFNVSPTLNYIDAYNNASKYMTNDYMCIEYTLGIYDEKAIRNTDTAYYTLAWKYEGLKTGNTVYVNAHDGSVIYLNTPFIIE